MRKSVVWLRFVLIATVATTGFACALTMSHPIYSRGSQDAVDLDGRSVMVLPPFTVGAEAAPAMVGRRTTELLFTEPLGNVKFELPERDSAALETIESLHTALTKRLPARFKPDGTQKRMIDKKLERSDQKLRRHVVDFRKGGVPDTDLTPAFVEPELLSAFDADYVLLSVAFGSYRQVSDIWALYGILPFGSQWRLLARPPSAVFALYRPSNGERVWESYIASENPGFQPSQFEPLAVDPRTLPYIGAAYLLTGDIETPFQRVYDSPLPESR